MPAQPDPSRVSRWGHSLAVRIPAHLARQTALQEGSPIEFSVAGQTLVISPAKEEAPRYDLTQLLAGITQENRHEEIDLGDAIGAERL